MMTYGPRSPTKNPGRSGVGEAWPCPQHLNPLVTVLVRDG